MNTHSYNPPSIFGCKSNFTPKPIISITNTIPETVKEERRKDNGIVYLPGEKLLLSLSKQKAKQKAKQKVKQPDVDRITKSLNRVLLSI